AQTVLVEDFSRSDSQVTSGRRFACVSWQVHQGPLEVIAEEGGVDGRDQSQRFRSCPVANWGRAHLGNALAPPPARTQTPTDLVAHTSSPPSTDARTSVAPSPLASPASGAGGWPRSEWPVRPRCWWAPGRVR